MSDIAYYRESEEEPTLTDLPWHNLKNGRWYLWDGTAWASINVTRETLPEFLSKREAERGKITGI